MKLIANTEDVIRQVLGELPELYEARHNMENDNDSLYDYLDGSIEARISMLTRLGVAPEDIPTDKYQENY
jgi:hypothetical protein